MPTNQPNLDVAHEIAELESLRDPTVNQNGKSARDFRRYVARGEATLYASTRRTLDDTGKVVHLRDVGRGGLGFVCHEALPVGTDWRIVFKYEGYAAAENAICIRHVKQVREGIYLIGANFVASAGLLTLLGVDPGALENEYAGADRPCDPGTVDGLPPQSVEAVA